MSNYLIVAILLLSCSWAKAHEHENLKKLSTDPHWLKLLHYKESFSGDFESDIKSESFFIAKNGKRNPLAELEETIKAINSSKTAYCQFPARRLWLESNGLTFEKHECEGYDEWTRGQSVKSISMIFASGFLGNPASFFGHPLLKFNFKDERSPLDLLDTAINYGAFTPPDVSPVAYAFKGIFGGYEAGFTSADFFFHTNNYAELELRDMWEYELDLKPIQIETIVAHLWEMKDAKLTYYFFSDNCAYRMSELLELVTDKKFVSRSSPFAVPSSLFHRIYEYSLFTNLKLLKSRQSRMSDKVLTLSENERFTLDQITHDTSYLISESFKTLPDDKKAKVLDAAIDYYSFRVAADKADSGLKETRKILLKTRISLPPKSYLWNDLKQNPPHEAQRPTLTQIGFTQSEKFGRIGTFRFRPVYYDLVSPDPGRPPYSSLAVLDVELNATNERTWIKNLNLISIETLNISKTGLKGDGGFAWRLKAGADQVNLSCNTCTVPRVEFGAGKAIELSDSIVLFAMIDPRVQTHLEDYGYLSLTPSLSSIVTFSQDFRLLASAGKRYQIDEGMVPENIFNIESRIGSSRTWDLRITFQQHIDRRYGLAVGAYW